MPRSPSLMRKSLEIQESPNQSNKATTSSNRLLLHNGSNPGRPKNTRSNELHRVTNIPPQEASRVRNVVRQTRMLYESIRMYLASETNSNSKPKRRSDMRAGAAMNERSLWLNRDNRTVGFIPGILIGDVFFYRMELCVLGLHGQVQAGIDSVPPSPSTGGEPIATSIVLSGGYEDNIDNGNVVIYTGHGGREGKNDVKQATDQKLEGSNLAMERSCRYGVEIRVIRGFDYLPSPSKRIYVYDGLYKVVKCWPEEGKSGFRVYKFKLVRIEGQERMGSELLCLAKELKESKEVRDGYLKYDMAKGKESFPVSLYNDIDEVRTPLKCEYLVRPTFKSVSMKDIGGKGCSCIGMCSSTTCSCYQMNGCEFVYDKDGKLKRGKPVIYECGKHCSCGSSCGNRVTGRGMKHRLEVFRSKETEWGVRSLDLICAGEFVCEISGVILRKEEGEVADMNERVLIHPNKLPERWREWGDLSKYGIQKDDEPALHVEYMMDVTDSRNVGCYFSHGWNPNVFVQYVLNSHYNREFPRLMVFAMANIPPLGELSLDYGDLVD